MPAPLTARLGVVHRGSHACPAPAAATHPVPPAVSRLPAPLAANLRPRHSYLPPCRASTSSSSASPSAPDDVDGSDGPDYRDGPDSGIPEQRKWASAAPAPPHLSPRKPGDLRPRRGFAEDLERGLLSGLFRATDVAGSLRRAVRGGELSPVAVTRLETLPGTTDLGEFYERSRRRVGAEGIEVRGAIPVASALAIAALSCARPHSPPLRSPIGTPAACPPSTRAFALGSFPDPMS